MLILEGLGFIAGTGFNPDSYSIPLLSVHWRCTGVKQGVKTLQRIGIDV